MVYLLLLLFAGNPSPSFLHAPHPIWSGCVPPNVVPFWDSYAVVLGLLCYFAKLESVFWLLYFLFPQPIPSFSCHVLWLPASDLHFLSFSPLCSPLLCWIKADLCSKWNIMKGWCATSETKSPRAPRLLQLLPCRLGSLACSVRSQLCVKQNTLPRGVRTGAQVHLFLVSAIGEQERHQ